VLIIYNKLQQKTERESEKNSAIVVNYSNSNLKYFLEIHLIWENILAEKNAKQKIICRKKFTFLCKSDLGNQNLFYMYSFQNKIKQKISRNLCAYFK
jgi:hypothetical protein